MYFFRANKKHKYEIKVCTFLGQTGNRSMKIDKGMLSRANNYHRQENRSETQHYKKLQRREWSNKVPRRG